MIDRVTEPEIAASHAGPRGAVRLLVFSASLRAGSLNTRLADLAASLIAERGGIVDAATMAEFDGPSFNQDVQERSGLPAGPAALCERVEANDAFVIAAPSTTDRWRAC